MDTYRDGFYDNALIDDGLMKLRSLYGVAARLRGSFTLAGEIAVVGDECDTLISGIAAALHLLATLVIASDSCNCVWH